MTDTVNKIMGALADPKAPWYGSDLVAWVGDLLEDYKQLEAKNKEQKELIDQLCSQEPCPKCGYGVTGACYGCIIKELEAELKQVKEALTYAHCQLVNINATRKALNKFEINLEIIEQAQDKAND